MSIDKNKIKKLYGNEVLNDIENNIETVKNNLTYLYIIGLENANDIFERYAILFLDDNEQFKRKVSYLYDKYKYDIDNNFYIWEEVL